MIRLYVDKVFQEGEKLGLPKSELKYFETVRRSRGPVVLFNRQGQIARGEVDSDQFSIHTVEESKAPIYPVEIVMGLPEMKTLKRLIPQLSELGVGALKVFEAERSQSGEKRMKDSLKEKLELKAIESNRQCGRGKLLEIEFGHLDEVLQSSDEDSVCFDEVGEESFELSSRPPRRILIGPEGGWTAAEREKIQASKLRSYKLPTPILRVETAVLLAASWGVLTHAAMQPSVPSPS